MCAFVSIGEGRVIEPREEEVRELPGEAVTMGTTSAGDTGGGVTERGGATIVSDRSGKGVCSGEF